MKTEEMIGKRYGRQVVVDICPQRNYVIVECDCGLRHTVRADSLTREISPVLSCGCLRREKAAVVGADRPQKYKSHKARKDSTTGVKGVGRKRESFTASICVNYNNIYLGTFHSLDEARNARMKAEDKFYKPIIERGSK